LQLDTLQAKIIRCDRCPRLREHCARIAAVKRRAYQNETYWGKPVPSFGDPKARLLILGLAPGAHGSNRTGRMFTGDSSGDILYRVLHATGFASQPTSRSATDGLTLHDAWITASAHCAPPGNKPAREEILACRDWLKHELLLLPRVQVVVALGRIAFDNYLDILRTRDLIASRSAYPFGHGVIHRLKPTLIGSYHPSQQNTSTGKLTESMLLDIFRTARQMIQREIEYDHCL
jgi:uracil-DNA glycosylase family 4